MSYISGDDAMERPAPKKKPKPSKDRKEDIAETKFWQKKKK